MKGIEFVCPDCKKAVHCTSIVLQRNETFLVGKCSQCHEGLRFCVESILATLFDVPCVVVLKSTKTVQ